MRVLGIHGYTFGDPGISPDDPFDLFSSQPESLIPGN